MIVTQEISQMEYSTQFHHLNLKSVKTVQEIFKLSNFLLHQCKFQIIEDQKNIQKVTEENQNHQISLESLFPIKKISFNQPKIDYLNSFVPKIDILFKYKSIMFKVTKTQIPNFDQLLPHQNQVNSHLFKPRYRENKDFLQCYVPTQQIMIKTMVGLYQIFELHKIPQPLVSYTKTDDTDIEKLISHWKLQNSILFCRIQSLITYLLIQWLHCKNKDQTQIQSLIIELESSRLNKQKLPFKTTLDRIMKSYGLSRTQFFQYFLIQEQKSQSMFFYGANFTFKGKRISAVMLPWGLQLANDLVNTLYMLNPTIQKVVIIGGVGFTGQRDCNIDDIFIPNSCIFGNQDNFEKVNINNGIKGTFNTEFFTQNKAIEGCIRSVYPQVGKLSQIVGLQKVIGQIDAIEMEFEAIYKRAMKGKSDFGAIFYVMDNLYKNIHLGSTYYNRKFLQGLFKKYERGKHFCYEKTLKYLTE